MHALSLYALSALFLQPLLAVPTTLSLLTSSNSLPSPISLAFYPFGSQIPSAAVNAAFGGAITKIYPVLQSRPDDPITNDEFHYQAVGGSVHIGVAAALRHGVTWQLLNTVLRRVSGFMNGVVGGRQHMQALTFEISKGGDRVGEGFVLYRPDPPLLNLKDAILVARAAPSLELSTVNATHYKIPDTNTKLVFGFFGDAIPDSGVSSAFEGAHSQIVYPLSLNPGLPIPHNRFDFTKSGVRITVIGNQRTMTWKQLSRILGGLYGFMVGPPKHNQVLTCEIYEVGHGRKGYASVWYNPPSVQVTKRALLNTTAHVPLVLNVGDFQFPVPGTTIVLEFTYLGRSIPDHTLEEAIWAALDRIRHSWPAQAAAPIPGNTFFQELKGVKISVFANVPHVLSWDQLHTIVWGLLLYVTGAERGEKHHMGLNFDVDDALMGRLAYGTVRYRVPEVADSEGKN